MRTLTRSFAQGLLVLAPVAITVWVVWFIVTTLDRWLGTSIPGLGIVIAAAGITLIGYLTGNVVGNKVVSWLEAGMQRVPIIKVLYSNDCFPYASGVFETQEEYTGNPQWKKCQEAMTR